MTLSPCTSAVIDSHAGFGILTTSQQVIRSLIGPCWTDQASNMNKLYRYPDGSRKYLVYPTFLYPVNVTLIERSSLGSRTPRFGSNVRVYSPWSIWSKQVKNHYVKTYKPSKLNFLVSETDLNSCYCYRITYTKSTNIF